MSELLTKDEIDFLDKNLLKVSIFNFLSMEKNQVETLNADIERQLEFYQDCSELNDSLLTHKYFKNVYPDEDFDENGNFYNKMIKSTVFEILTKDNGTLSLLDIYEDNAYLFPVITPISNEIMEKLKRFENPINVIFDYYYINFKEKFRFNSNEAFIAVQEIPVL